MKALLLLALAIAPAAARSWSDEVLYFALTDRFHDGDPSNNTPPGCDPALDDPAQENINLYHGGDLRGLELALQGGYFSELGVTALWITPPVRNVWRSGYDAGGWKTGYHGYWAQDFLDIDPHLTSATSLAGKPYPEGAEGRMEHYRDFVALAHAKGIRVVQDVVLNHAGPVFYYDADGDGVFDSGSKDEWVQPFERRGFHDNARWAGLPQWNMARTEPTGPRELLGRRLALSGVLGRLDAYGRKGFSPDSLGKNDGEEVMCDFFSLRDLWTDPEGANFDRLVDEFVSIYHFYLHDVGVDGLRIDTVKHVHHEFWDAFTRRLRQRLGSEAADKILFGEVFDGSPAKLGEYTWRTDAPADPSPCLDSVLAFQLCFALRDYLLRPGEAYGNARPIEAAMSAFSDGRFPDGRFFYNRTPGADGLNSLQKSVTFVENHDSINRFRVAGITERRNQLAQGLVMTLPGIPCLYYGAEVSLQDGRGNIGQDSETGRMTLWRHGAAPTLEKLRQDESFRAIQRLARARREFPALREGGFRPLWCDSDGTAEDDGLFAFARTLDEPGASVIVVCNLSPKEGLTGPLEVSPLLPRGANWRGDPVIGRGGPRTATDRFSAPPRSLVIYRAQASEPARPGTR
ncbi:alpha-amylase family glycosyl hydrolase [Haloferula sargassicola]|uniref:alpha-amylase family glycosyl hydrolase n=1 Tax=Haloferula sargassicola TaxID=490096 RepID=UPI0033653F61